MLVSIIVSEFGVLAAQLQSMPDRNKLSRIRTFAVFMFASFAVLKVPIPSAHIRDNLLRAQVAK